MILSKAIKDFRKYVSITKSQGTQDYYQYYLDLLSDELGHLDTEEIDNNVILDYILRRKEINPEVSNATLNKHITTLKSAVKYSTGKKLNFAKLKERKKIIPTISRETVNRVFEHLQKHMKDCFQFRNYVYLKLLHDTGLRLNEMNNIRLTNIK